MSTSSPAIFFETGPAGLNCGTFGVQSGSATGPGASSCFCKAAFSFASSLSTSSTASSHQAFLRPFFWRIRSPPEWHRPPPCRYPVRVTRMDWKQSDEGKNESEKHRFHDRELSNLPVAQQSLSHSFQRRPSSRTRRVTLGCHPERSEGPHLTDSVTQATYCGQSPLCEVPHRLRDSG